MIKSVTTALVASSFAAALIAGAATATAMDVETTGLESGSLHSPVIVGILSNPSSDVAPVETPSILALMLGRTAGGRDSGGGGKNERPDRSKSKSKSR